MRTSKIQFPKRFSFFFLLFCILGIMGYARSQQNTIFHAVVAKDGTGDYTTVQSAIDAVPENLKSPWLIFVKNGSYEEQVIIPQNKPFIHLIGQDKERTIIHLKLNVGGKPDANTKTTPDAYKFGGGLEVNEIRLSYIGKPGIVKFNEDIGGTDVDCELPESMHVDIVKHAVDLYRTALNGGIVGAQGAQQQQQRENVRNNVRDEGYEPTSR